VLSEEALAEFTPFFLTVYIDQVDFMESLVQPDRLRARVLVWAEEEVRWGELPTQAGGGLEAVLHRGSCRVARWMRSQALGKGRDAGFWPRWLRRACWRRKARARRCI
jgi:hypothetical protein